MTEYRGCQLANHWKGWPEGVASVLVEPKVDGYRLSGLVHDDGHVVFHCREPEPPKWVEHLGHVALELEDLGLPPGTMVDGEVMAEDWNETSKLLRRFRVDMDDDDRERIRREVKFHVFDLIDLHALETRAPVGRQRKPRLVEPTLQLQRSAYVRALLEGNLPSAALQTLPSFLCTSLEEVDAHYVAFCAHYEGAMAKLPCEPYYFNRSDAWLKLKPSTTTEMTITGAVEGTGKHVGRLGALLGVLASGVEVRVGTGQSDAERESLWAQRALLVGRRCEISHQTGNVAGARHPVFLRVRDLG